MIDGKLFIRTFLAAILAGTRISQIDILLRKTHQTMLVGGHIGPKSYDTRNREARLRRTYKKIMEFNNLYLLSQPKDHRLLPTDNS